MDYIWVILLIVLGLAMLIKPEILWRIEHMLTVKNGEPTELYLALMRIGGIFFAGAGIVVLIVSLVN
ncbi:MAG: DUF6199 family natural product biosynthesis protein [Candidatus Gastranaerophilaceae bacterium]|jgi:hypothetical protein|nr:hypothetical protein [Christensenellales bacterium]